MSGRRQLQPVPDSEATPEFLTFTLTELLSLEDEDLDQIDGLHGEAEKIWWALWRAERLEEAGREVRDVEEAHDNDS